MNNATRTLHSPQKNLNPNQNNTTNKLENNQKRQQNKNGLQNPTHNYQYRSNHIKYDKIVNGDKYLSNEKNINYSDCNYLRSYFLEFDKNLNQQTQRCKTVEKNTETQKNSEFSKGFNPNIINNSFFLQKVQSNPEQTHMKIIKTLVTLIQSVQQNIDKLFQLFGMDLKQRNNIPIDQTKILTSQIRHKIAAFNKITTKIKERFDEQLQSEIIQAFDSSDFERMKILLDRLKQSNPRSHWIIQSHIYKQQAIKSSFEPLEDNQLDQQLDQELIKPLLTHLKQLQMLIINKEQPKMSQRMGQQKFAIKTPNLQVLCQNKQRKQIFNYMRTKINTIMLAFQNRYELQQNLNRQNSRLDAENNLLKQNIRDLQQSNKNQKQAQNAIISRLKEEIQKFRESSSSVDALKAIIESNQMQLQAIRAQASLNEKTWLQTGKQFEERITILTNELQKTQHQNKQLQMAIQEKQKQFNEYLKQAKCQQIMKQDKLFIKGSLIVEQQAHHKFLYEQIAKLGVGRPKNSRLIYKMDTLNKTDPHLYFDNKENLLIIIKTTNQIIGSFVTSSFNKDRPTNLDENGKAIIFTLNRQSQVYQKIEGKGSIKYDPRHLIIGNNDLTIFLIKNTLVSHLGNKNSHFNNKGQQAYKILNENKGILEVQIQLYQIFRVELDDKQDQKYQKKGMYKQSNQLKVQNNNDRGSFKQNNGLNQSQVQIQFSWRSGYSEAEQRVLQ